MTPTTHIAISCFITAGTIQSDMPVSQQYLVAVGGSFLSHFIFDFIPHGFICGPREFFKKTFPTIVEITPGPLILFGAVAFFGNGIIFLMASFFGMLPDFFSILYYRKKNLAEKIPGLVLIHRAHRKIHWFETDHPDGMFSYRYPNSPLLAAESVFSIFILIMLFKQSVF